VASCTYTTYVGESRCSQKFARSEFAEASLRSGRIVLSQLKSPSGAKKSPGCSVMPNWASSESGSQYNHPRAILPYFSSVSVAPDILTLRRVGGMVSPVEVASRSA
jgi:hypothetical protein